MNVFCNTIVLVKDINVSKKFYTEVLGLKIITDYETIVTFENHFVIHDSNNLLKTIFGKKTSHNPLRGKKNIDIYFESDNLDAEYKKVSESGTKIIHEIQQQHWGQKVFRFYDPDNHIVEIGEPFHSELINNTDTPS